MPWKWWRLKIKVLGARSLNTVTVDREPLSYKRYFSAGGQVVTISQHKCYSRDLYRSQGLSLVPSYVRSVGILQNALDP